MGNGPLANQEPLEMPNGNVIDLSYSQVPAAWLEQQTVPDTTDPIPGGWVKVADLPASNEFIIQRQIDIMFSPQGVVTGPLAAAGKIHLLLAEIEDTLVNRAPELAEGENIITSIYTNTGNIAAAPVDKTNPPAYYNFAESGEVAGR